MPLFLFSPPFLPGEELLPPDMVRSIVARNPFLTREPHALGLYKALIILLELVPQIYRRQRFICVHMQTPCKLRTGRNPEQSTFKLWLLEKHISSMFGIF